MKILQRIKNKNSDPEGLAGRIGRFAEFLKSHGFGVFQSSVHDALRSLGEIDLSKRQDFFVSLRANLTNTDLEWVQFGNLFDTFWNKRDKEKNETHEPSHLPEQDVRTPISMAKVLHDIDAEISTPVEHTDEKEWLEGVAYSPLSKVEKKDIGSFEKADIQLAQLALKKIMAPFKIHLSRRYRPSRKSTYMDFRRIMSNSLKSDGLPMALFYKGKKKRLKRLVILADVSGSMDRYARFVMPFILGLRRVGSRAEVFVFSTSLTSITFLIRHLSFEKALKRIAQEVPDWSGGTKIGYSLHQFNQIHAQRLLNQRTVAIILSDGWDLGGKALLRREMETLARKAYCVIWLNPLAGDPDYQPVCQGMRTALPFVDYFLPADSLHSLQQVGRLLSKVMTH